tara:strand:- start:593 stop:1111 length:519 start_codon:yes stop_codon:yes gene_type:complete
MNKLIIYIDMDGVLANFGKAAEEHPDNGTIGYEPDLILDFSKFEPMPGAINAVKELTEMGHDLFIATTPPWDHPDSWAQKRTWVLEHLPQFKKRMFLTHRKDLLKGEILIDDSSSRGQAEFEGTWFHFGKNGIDWKYVVEGIRGIMQVEKTWEPKEVGSEKSDFLPHNLKNK